MVLNLLRVKRLALGIDSGRDHVRALIHVGKHYGWTDARLRVEARAPVSVTAGPNLEVKRAVHSVLLRPENRRQMLCHFLQFLRFAKSRTRDGVLSF